MNNTNLTAAATTAMALINALDQGDDDAAVKRNPGTALVALAANLVLASEAAGISVQDIMTATTNVMNHSDGRRPEFKAAADFLKKELFSTSSNN